SRAKAGEAELEVPVYSHVRYDIVPGEHRVIARPDILIVEGLNVLQAGGSGAFVSDYFDFSIFVDADVADIREWYVRRFLTLKETAFREPDAYFRRYSGLTDEEAKEIALDIWTRINEVNLVENILPTRDRADLILEKVGDHSIWTARLRRWGRRRPAAGGVFFEEGSVRPLDAVAECGAGSPAHVGESRDVQELSRDAVGHRRIEDIFAIPAEYPAYQPSEFEDGQILAGSDIEVLFSAVVPQREENRVGEAIHVEELPLGPATAPQGDVLPPFHFGLVRLPEQGGEDVGGLQVVVVAGPVQVRRH